MKIPSKQFNLAIATVAVEAYVKDASLDLTQELPDVTAISDVGPRRVIGNYAYNLAINGDADFTSGLQDATIYGCLGTTAVKAMGFDPTGSTAAGASDPHFDATDIVMASYSLKAAVGAGVTYSAQFQGNSSMTRTVA